MGAAPLCDCEYHDPRVRVAGYRVCLGELYVCCLFSRAGHDDDGTRFRDEEEAEDCLRNESLIAKYAYILLRKDKNVEQKCGFDDTL